MAAEAVVVKHLLLLVFDLSVHHCAQLRQGLCWILAFFNHLLFNFKEHIVVPSVDAGQLELKLLHKGLKVDFVELFVVQRGDIVLAKPESKASHTHGAKTHQGVLNCLLLLHLYACLF